MSAFWSNFVYGVTLGLRTLKRYETFEIKFLIA